MLVCTYMHIYIVLLYTCVDVCVRHVYAHECVYLCMYSSPAPRRWKLLGRPAPSFFSGIADWDEAPGWPQGNTFWCSWFMKLMGTWPAGQGLQDACTQWSTYMMEHGQLGHFARAELVDSLGAFEVGHRPWGGVMCPGYSWPRQTAHPAVSAVVGLAWRQRRDPS